ncbi:MAG TPA: hypothetical protein VJ650_16975 [Gemmatimonadaceae bacterium]|nr:hypothetical protein [Gemmatimonadaceae bacterium]
MTGPALLFGLAWFTIGWVMGAWPITAAIALGAMVVDRNVDAPPRLGRWKVFSPLAVTALTLVWASVFYSPAHAPPPQLPWYAYVVGGLYALQLVLAGLLVRESVRRGHTLAVVVLPQLWVGLLASFVSVWAVTSGGTLGAL